MPRLSNSAAALGVAALVVAGGGAYAFASSSGSSISVCVKHNGGVLYKAKKCVRHDMSLTWNQHGPRGAAGPQGIAGQPGATGAQGVSGPPGATGQGPALAVWNDDGAHLTAVDDTSFHSLATARIPAAGLYTAVAKVDSYVQSGSGIATSICQLTARADAETGSGEYDQSEAGLQNTAGVNASSQTQAMEVTHSFSGPGTINLACQQNGLTNGGAYLYWSNAKIIATRVSSLANTQVSR
jgi:hypothetical protein